MLFPHKKASMESIGIIIIIIISIGLMISIFFSLVDTSEEILEGKDCQVALGVQEASNSIPFVTYQNSCKTIVVDMPQAKKKDVKSNQDVSKEIAKKMMRTWDITHKGTITNMWSGDFTLFTGSDCLVLYEINIEYIPDEGYSQSQLYDYMFEENFTVIDGLTKTYLSYVQTAGDPGVLLFPESSTYSEVENIPVFSTDKSFLIEEGAQYAISIASPTVGLFDFSGDANNILIFSSVAYAESTLGCVRK